MTSNYEPEKALTSYSPPNIVIPEDWGEARRILEERIIRDASATNEREVAQYVEDEIVTGQKWFKSGDANSFRQTFRKVVRLIRTDVGGNTPGLNDFTATNPQNVPHGLPAGSTGFVVTRIYGSATDGGTMYLPLPFTDSTGAAHIELCMDATNIILRSAADYSAYTEASVVMEYVRD